MSSTRIAVSSPRHGRVVLSGTAAAQGIFAANDDAGRVATIIQQQH